MSYKKSYQKGYKKKIKLPKPPIKQRTKHALTATGIYRGNTHGYGFVSVEGLSEDVHISGKYTAGAIDGDTVEIVIRHPSDGSHRAEGEVKRVISRGRDTFVGTYERGKGYGFVVVDDTRVPGDIFIRYENSKKAVTGSKVVVRVIDFADAHSNAEGEIVEILGHEDDPGVDILAIARSYGIYDEFPEDVMREACALPDKVRSKDIKGRKDFRKKLTITIDGDDTKDIDDAISLERTKKGFRLGVHIADVSHYVTEGSALDTEALHRGTSVYLADRVIPMLPHSLSNGICSLNEKSVRLTLSCVMKFDDKGNMTDHEICESVIKSNHRMTYDEVLDILDNPAGETAAKYEDVVPMLNDALALSSLLRKKRKKRGSIDFDFPECKIKLDKAGKPVYVSVYERNKAHLIIEDFMLAANETVAEEFYRMKLPFLYRVHETPDEDKMKALLDMLSELGVKLPKLKGIDAKELQSILTKVAGTPDESFVQTVVLRSMQRARYAPDCLGHFGLAAKYYCHFTSPIRRYPDLQIHRIIKAYLAGKMNKKAVSHFEKILPDVAQHTSVTERRADEAERESEKLKKVEFMEDKLGEVFTGTISGVTSWGLYVALPNTIEGLVSAQSMRDDYYIFDEKKLTMTGERTKRRYRLGDTVKVQLVRADKQTKTIDFILYEKSAASKEVRKNAGKQRAYKADRK